MLMINTYDAASSNVVRRDKDMDSGPSAPIKGPRSGPDHQKDAAFVRRRLDHTCLIGESLTGDICSPRYLEAGGDHLSLV